ncbi:MAG: AI-2E family transporter [Blastocatellia bacterium]|nr:AI-2E family transporter [Blastocatellia bacterium]
MVRKRITIIFLLALTALALALCFIVFRPFIRPVLSATVIAIVFFPVQAKMLRIVRNPSLAALLSIIVVVLIIVIPATLIGIAITSEVRHLYQLLNERSAASGGISPFLTDLIERPLRWIGQYMDVSQFDPQAALLERLKEMGTFLLAEAGIVVGNITSFILNTVIAFFTLFFLFREGKSIRRRAAAILPLTPDQVERLFNGVENTIMATVYGGLVVAAVQGSLTGLALWVLGVPSPVLWGVVATMLSLIPMVGSAFVWVPAAIFLIATGNWVKAIILVGWGAGVVGTIDNILRPYLMSGRVQMHTLLIFFAVFGGVQAFGILGLFVGPVILAITMTLLGMLREESRWWLAPASDESLPAQTSPAPAPNEPLAEGGKEQTEDALQS